MRTAVTHIYERVGKETVSIADNVTNGTFTFKKSGVLKGIAWESSNYSAGTPFTISIKDAEDTVLYTSGNLAANSSAYISSLDVVLVDETHTVTVATGDPVGQRGVIGVSLLIQR